MATELLYIDLFCGAGGTSTGVERMKNPDAKVVLWASLECTNHSRAKGGMSRDADSRTLAEHLFRYIEELQPDYIQIENVVEFMEWGPLRVKVVRSAGRSISYEATGSVFKPLSSDANTLDGKNASCTIVDEFHAHKTDEVYAVMMSSMDARRCCASSRPPVSTSQASDIWIADDVWCACRSETPVESLAGCACYAGLDLGSVNDFSSLVLAFHENDRTQLLPFFWIPEEKYRTRREMQRENANIDVWVRQGLLRVTPGNVTDYEVIRRDIARLAGQYDIRKIGYDRWNSSQLVIDLLNDGLPMDGFQQSISNISPPTKEFERLARSGDLEHYGNPVLRWMVSNVVVYRDANDNLKPVKNRSPEKIDGVVAAIEAIGEWMSAQRTPPARSIYEERGLRTF